MNRIIRFSALAILLLLLLTEVSNAQSFLGLDGGFEGTATIDNTGSSSGAQSGKWTRAGTVSSIVNETGTVRSGNNSMKISSTKITSARR